MRLSLRWAITLLLVVAACPTWATPDRTAAAAGTFTPHGKTGRPGATADERQLGALAADQLIREYGLVQDEAMQARVDSVGRSLARYAPGGGVGYRFRILRSDDVNAMTTPDGQVFVTRQLMRVFKSDDQLAAVLAHEISHVVLGHTSMLLSEPDEERTVVVGHNHRGKLIRRTVTVTSESKKRWEFEADEAGLGLLEIAGYPVEAMQSILEFLAD